MEKGALNIAKNKKQGFNSWNQQGTSNILMKSITSSKLYQKRVKYIHCIKGFGKDHVLLPLFVPQKINGVSMSVPICQKCQKK